MEAEYEPLNKEFRKEIEPNFATKDWYTEHSSDPIMNKVPKEENYEFLYLKTFVKLVILAVLIRKYEHFCNIDMTTKVKILREIREGESDKKLIFTKQDVWLHGGDFSQKVKDEIMIKEVCNYIIHCKTKLWPYVEKDGEVLKLDGETMIYIGLATDKNPEVIFINFSNLLTRIGEIIENIKKL